MYVYIILLLPGGESLFPQMRMPLVSPASSSPSLLPHIPSSPSLQPPPLPTPASHQVGIREGRQAGKGREGGIPVILGYRHKKVGREWQPHATTMAEGMGELHIWWQDSRQEVYWEEMAWQIYKGGI